MPEGRPDDETHGDMEIFRMLLAYFGPETMLPLTSIVAAVGGFLLMFGRNTLRFASLAWRTLRAVVGAGGPGPAARAVKRPHVLSRDRYAPETASRTESERADA